MGSLLKRPGHMTKMATMPIYGKNLKKSSSLEPKRQMTLKLGMHQRVLKYYQICSNDDRGLTLTCFTARSDLVPYAFVWEKGKTMDFSETIVVYDLKLATNEWNDKTFLFTSKLCPLGAVCPCPRAIYMYMYSMMKKLYKIRLQRNFYETCNKWVKW